MKDEKASRIVFVVLLAVGIVLCTAGFSGCATGPNRIGTEQPILDAYGAAKGVEAELQYNLGRIDAAAEQLDHIRIRAEEQGQGIDEIIRGFEEYQYTVSVLLRNYRELRDRTGSREENKVDGVDSGRGAGNGAHPPGNKSD